MTFAEAWRDYLAALAVGVSDLGGRVYNERAPERPGLPYLTIHLVSVDPLMTHSGAPVTQCRTYQHSIFAGSQSQAQAIADKLRQTINGTRAFTVGSGAFNVRAVLLRSEGYMYEDDTKLHHVHQDYDLKYFEPVL